jgi:hypothetical protein
MARPPTPPSNLRQDTFISSTEVRTSYIKPFATRHYFAFIKDPRWPPAFIDNGGVRVYVREKIDEFLRRIAAEGFEPGAGNEATHSGRPLDGKAADTTRNRRPRSKTTLPNQKRIAQRAPEPQP